MAFLSGCATTWTDAQRAGLSTVKVATSALAKDAYQKPDAKVSPGMANSIPMATGGGLIPSLIGSAIDASVTAKQQKKYEEGNLKYFEGLRKAMAEAPTKAVDSSLRTMLTSDQFFGTRLNEDAGSAFSTEILQYGLVKSPLSPKDDVLLRVRICAKITLKLANGSTLLETTINGIAATAKHADEILADPEFFAVSAKEAANNLADQLQVLLGKKLASSAKS